MKKTDVRTRLYGAACVGFALLFAFAALDSLFNNQSLCVTYRIPLLAVGAALCGCVLWVLWKLFGRLPALSAGRQRLVVGVLLALFLCVQLAVGMVMRVEASAHWDFGIVREAAAQNALTGAVPQGDYFTLWPNNAPVYLLLAWLMRLPAALWGTEPACYAFAVVCNCLFANLSLFLCYRAACRLFGARVALFGLLCSFLLLPFTAYMPIVYTDTLTLIFPVGMLILWLGARDTLVAQGPRTRAAWLRVCARLALLGGLCAVGAKLKITVAIALAAIVLDALLLLRWRRALAACGVCCAAFGLGMGLLGLYCSRTALLPPRKAAEAVPYAHWVMMGLHGVGNYYDPDYQLTLSQDTYEARKALDEQVIMQRLREFGAGGFLRHCADKLSFIFGDGT